MREQSDRDYGDENDFDDVYHHEDSFYLDDEDDDINLGGSLVPNRPLPNGPSFGDTIALEK
jgi:hypothetical protein